MTREPLRGPYDPRPRPGPRMTRARVPRQSWESA